MKIGNARMHIYACTLTITTIHHCLEIRVHYPISPLSLFLMSVFPRHVELDGSRMMAARLELGFSDREPGSVCCGSLLSAMVSRTTVARWRRFEYNGGGGATHVGKDDGGTTLGWRLHGFRVAVARLQASGCVASGWRWRGASWEREEERGERKRERE